MQTIIIIERDIEELDRLLAIFHEWHTELDILTARDEDNALNIMKNHQIDIVLCSTSIINKTDQSLLTTIATVYPSIPCIGLCDEHMETCHAGASFCHTKPYNSALLFEHITELLVFSEIESIKNIPTHSLLQMLETEERTCTMKVYGKNDTGLIFIQNGVPIAAETELTHGESAFFEIIGWEDTVAEILHFNGQRKKEIDKPLIAMIMEGLKVKDEQDNNGFGLFGTPQSDRAQLKKISTIGQRISLDIGSRVKLEFNQIEGSYNSTTVGMLPDEFLVLTCPSQLITMNRKPTPGTQLLTKYVHMGKLCLFKSRILTTIENPQDLLFVEYPASIHYHELRQAKRARIFIPCTLNFPTGGEFFGALVDLSSSGGLCVIKTKVNQALPAIQIDQQIELRCLLPGMKEEQQINGIIKNVKQNSNESKFGIEFFNMHSYLIETINRYLYSIDN